LNKTEIKELSILPKKQENKKLTKPREMLEKIERDRKKREEKEKLKILEKLEAQVIKKKKLNQLPGNPSSTNNSNYTNTESYNTTKDPSKRLIDNINTTRKTPHDNLVKIDEKLLDDSGFRKTIRKEKIEIICDKTENELNKSERDKKNFYTEANFSDFGNKEKILIDLEIKKSEKVLEKEFWANLSKDKKKFFMLKLSEVYEFLNSIKLVRFIETFIEDGIENLECILGK
jgi:hypothetical protein